ncbi:flagellar hook-associated protein 2 [Halanaerobium congolense]|jgi:flagellar hook-associated protein 2|uniref:Flagellar hook-associated protein 2 n=2 Tax=Halanaerobium congolense TaxID=54121 RepID=A0A1G8NZ06_9FIRM|nr:MAG: flagellar hook-associated protein 2 [Halanaerobium sp.]SDI85439.1 flagellar hook-associated protein 2 [Halanaerobium congolense]SET55858.1 flagellar hook-associated protein 2 [Halanaerobium congolense]
MQLDGLATGMDTTAVIDQLVQLERRPIYNYQQEISEIEQTKGAWRDVNSRLDKLEDRTTDLKLSSTFNSRSASSSDGDVVTASASNDSNEANYSIIVNNVASTQRISGNRLDDSTTAIKDLTGFGSIAAENNIQINGTDITINDSDSLTDISNKINDVEAGVSASIVDNHLVLESTDTGEKNQIALVDDNDLFKSLGVLQTGDNDGSLSTNLMEVQDADTALGLTGSFQIDVEGGTGTGEITVDETTTLNDIKSQIDALGGDLSASVTDEGNGYFSLSINSSTAGSDVKLSNTGTENILADLAFGNRSYQNELQTAEDANIDINGITGITSSTNTFSEAVEGVTFNISTDAEIDSTATISVAKDTGKAADAVQAFVDQYNSVMSFLDGKTDYDEETEKGAVLQGDSTAMRLQTRLRSLVSSKIKDTGDFKTLTSVGIEIDRDGVMSFDKTKFTEALEQSPEEVMSIFNGESETDGFDGMAVRMDSYLDQLMQSNTGLIPRRLDFYDTRIESLNDDIEDVERKVEMTRARYVEQFAAMESAISEMNQQMSWMQSQISSLNVNSQASNNR